ncbi:GGDEF domain-containing protein [Thalassotalea fonticola]|uniref:diguanylate cyclase n=1 Tax=Thalassotalea fonticola TaxID=3065649 RepID=A0ABZ0GV71_9GAMM|nr:GGDEF domain-containing protein [Colwelliaceae bacterium S1-1]
MIKPNCYLLKQFKAFSKYVCSVLTILVLIPVFSHLSYATENLTAIGDLSTDELISKAIKVKSSDLELNQTIINALKIRSYNMNWQQQDQYEYLIAYEQILLGNYQQAIKLSRANINSRNINFKLRAYNTILFLNVLLGQYLDAAENIKPVLAALKSPQLDTETFINTYTTLAYFYNQLDEPQQALEFVEHVVVSDDMHISDRQQCFLGMQHIYALQGLKKLQNNASLIDQYYDVCHNINEKLIADQIVSAHAFAQLNNNLPDKALKLLLGNYQHVLNQNYPQNHMRFNSYLAKAYLQLNNVSEAGEYADKALALASEHPYHPTLMFAYEAKYELAKFNQDKQAEFSSLRSKINLQHELALKSKEKSLALNSLKYDLKEIEGELLGYKTAINNELEQEQIKIGNNSVFANFLISNRLIQLVLFGSIIWLIRANFINWKIKQQIVADLVFDKSTHCLHRHAFLQQAKQLLTQAKQDSQPYSLVIMNIDNLREVNEIQGNDRSDRLINLVLNLHNQIFTEAGLVGRLGGDEFGFLLKDCAMKRAIELCEEYRLAINFLDTKQICYQFDVTASFGVSDTHISGYSMMKLLANTEQALKQAKDEFKNCTCGFESDTVIAR